MGYAILKKSCSRCYIRATIMPPSENFRPHQENIMKSGDVWFALMHDLKLLGYIELNCTDLKLAL